MKTLLHVGCGRLNINYLPKYFQDGSWQEIRYDIDPGVIPDIVGELQDMSLIEEGVVDALYSSHNIEHVWAFEVDAVLGEFHRVLSGTGMAMILCPDGMAVCQAIVAGGLEATLYASPAGPITAIDILYGHQRSIAEGNVFMAHKTLFTSETLGGKLLRAGFACVVIARDLIFGMHALAFKDAPKKPDLDALVKSLLLSIGDGISIDLYGSFVDI